MLISGKFGQIQAGDTLDAAVSEVDVLSKVNGEVGAIVIGNAVYVFSATDVKLARANAAGTSEVLGLVKDVSVASSASGFIQTDGVLPATTGQWDAVTGQSGGLTMGSPYYLDAATAGKLTVTAPTTVGQLVVRIGLALSSTELEISIQPPILL